MDFKGRAGAMQSLCRTYSPVPGQAETMRVGPTADRTTSGTVNSEGMGASLHGKVTAALKTVTPRRLATTKNAIHSHTRMPGSSRRGKSGERLTHFTATAGRGQAPCGRGHVRLRIGGPLARASL